MATKMAGSIFNKLFSLLILLLHVGCFLLTTPTGNRHSRKQSSPSKSKQRKLFFKPQTAFSSSFSFLKTIFSSYQTCKPINQTPPSTPSPSSHKSTVSPPLPELDSSDTLIKKPTEYALDSDISADNPFSPLRNDIFPCTACGEIFSKPYLLEQHQAIKHGVSELTDGDTSKNIVQIIFKTGWTSNEKKPIISRILKIHSSQKILSRFEEYREAVKMKAARNGSVRRRNERCIADGNELLRFHCCTFVCDLGVNGNSSLCRQQFCNACEIIKSGFSPKLDGISTLSGSWRAHVSIPEEMEEEFKFMNVKRAVMVCRVVAGRVGCEEEDAEKEDGGFDSVVGRNGSGTHIRLDEEELVVFNPRAVLPCFLIVYNVV